MSVPSTVEELLQLIRKSGMIDEPKLTAYLSRTQAGRGLSPEAREAADAMIEDGLITNFQAEQFMLGKWRGFTIGKFKLLERIGVGGMGQVFLCEHMFMHRRHAIKVLPPAKAEQPAALGRFYREARAAGALDHPNIVRTHDIDQDGNLHYIVMEYVDGTNLLDLVKKFGPMNIERAASYTRQVAYGLDYAFNSGIIHRDIKPGNVLINREGTAKLLDMGLARFYNDHSDNLTVKYDDKIVLGTADYVAPEQVANSHNVDIRADIYALGATLYFLLAGHPPFPNGTVSQKLLWHRTKDPTPLRQIRPEVPEGLAAIVEKMMQKEPAKRFQAPAEVMYALEAFAPEYVPAPAEAEMPVLCLAARENPEAIVAKSVPVAEPPRSQAFIDISSKMMSEVRSKSIAELRAELLNEPSKNTPEVQAVIASVGRGSEHRARPVSEFRMKGLQEVDSTPEPAHATVTSTATATVAAPARQRSGVSAFAPRTVPFKTKPVEQPYTDTVATADSDTGPKTNFPPQSNKGGHPGDFPIIAMPPADRAPQNRKYIFYGLIVASIVLAVGLAGWKLAGGKPKAASNPPAAVE